MTAPIPCAFRAAWIFPVVEPPIRNGVLEVDEYGIIRSLRSARDRSATDLGNVALVPGLVNVHAHLEFSDLSTPIGPSQPFPRWVKNVVAHRRDRKRPESLIINRGITEAASTGTAAIGEISTSDNLEGYSPSRLALTSFRELIGPLPHLWDDVLASAKKHLESCRSPSNVRRGISPHAPYTVPQPLFDRAIDLAVQFAAPVAVHLAESHSERSLLESGQGELVDMMKSLDLWVPEHQPIGRRPLDWIRLLARCHRGLIVHGNYLDDQELDCIAASSKLSLVYCPRTHAYFGHPKHPFRRLLDRTGRVAIGTDGRSSNPDLNLWSEGQYLRQRYPDLPSDTILELLTSSGANALGIGDHFGILSPGRKADFAAIQLSTTHHDEPPDLFESRQHLCRVFRGGVPMSSHDDNPPCHD